MNIPTVVLSGNHSISLVGSGQYGIIGCYSICKYFNISAEKAIAQASVLLEKLAASVIPGAME